MYVMPPENVKKSIAQAQPKTTSAKPTQKQPAARQYTVSTLRNEFYYDRYYFLAFVTLTLIAICIGFGLMAYYEHQLQNVPNQGYLSKQTLNDSRGNTIVKAGDPILKFPMTLDGKLIYPTPLSEPGMSTPAILEWAVDSIKTSFGFNFIDYEQIITNASILYTKIGYQNYRSILIGTGMVNNVERKKYVISVTPTSAPTILKEKTSPDGIYAWQIQYPIQLTFQNVKETLKSDWVVTMLIVRAPLSEAPRGVAIAALILREGRLPN
jgi:intracellular multiplication protein IcmL